tara:strand:+ start:618 stop:998 length:381 start_codon:yes stop_codon:yes gene_type:complete
MSFSNFLETKVLGHVFGATAYTAAGTLYLALFTSNPAEDGSGTEVTGGAYARQSVAFTVAGNNASNTSAVEYATATAGYGTVSHVGVYDAATSGNLLAYAALTSSKAIDTGDVFRVPTGDLDITLD